MAEVPHEIIEAIDQIVESLSDLEGAEEGETDEVGGTGVKMVKNFGALIRTSRTYDKANAAFRQPTIELRDTLDQLCEVVGSVELVFAEGQFYVDNVRLKFTGASGGVEEELSQAMKRFGVGGFTFHESLNAIQLRSLCACLSDPPDDEPNMRLFLMKALEARAVGSVDVRGEMRFRLTGEGDIERPDAVQLTNKAGGVIDACFDNLGANRAPNVKQVRRMITEIARHGSADELLLKEPVGATPFAAHTLRVCHVAMMLGRAVGLSNEALQDLGVASLFHDTGYAAREGADPTKGVEGFAPPFERHGMAGAKVLLRQRGFHVGKIRRALATIEHHRDYNHDRRPSLFGRILRIAEDYDNLIRLRGGGLPPSVALERMTQDVGTKYDPVLLQRLINTLGRYPPGTVMELQDGTIGRSISTVRFPGTFEQPLVQLLRDAEGQDYDDPPIVDLRVGIQVNRVMTAIG